MRCEAGDGDPGFGSTVDGMLSRILVALFITWAIRFLGASPSDTAATLHVHSAQSEMERKEFWSAVRGIDITRFKKTSVKQEGTGHRKSLVSRDDQRSDNEEYGDPRALRVDRRLLRPLENHAVSLAAVRAASSTG